MFDNISLKIKNTALVFFWGVTICSVIAGFALLDATNGASMLLALIGFLTSLVSAWCLYGFGEIIDKLCDIERNTQGGDKKANTQEKEVAERLAQIEKLRLEGLITVEEYQARRAEIIRQL